MHVAMCIYYIHVGHEDQLPWRYVFLRIPSIPITFNAHPKVYTTFFLFLLTKRDRFKDVSQIKV